ncbi:MAG TPA: HRDC domain-containing protein [Egicoccus sp.]|nr:HRDC domain-containing protein [Egicoccus sp.]HSK23078.1 HRDC domain-containing protein [Egicoccus sp.]
MSLHVHAVNSGAMAERTVALVRDRFGDGGLPSQAAVLARVNSALLPIQVALTEAGVAHTAPLDASVLGRTGVRTALAYLRLGLDPDRCQRDDLLDTLNRPARKVKSAVQPLLRRSTRWSVGQLEAMADALDPNHRERWTGYLGDLHHLAGAITDGADTARCLWIVRNRIGLGEAMDALDSSRTRPEGSSHGDDLDALEQLAALHTDPATFREWLVDRLRVPADPDGVMLSTVHRVKGMEWDHVVVFAASAGLFPHRLSEDVEEERRVFHVAITRGRRRVDVVADRERTSPFVSDLRKPGDAVPTDRSAAAVPAQVSPTRRPDGGIVAEAGLACTLPGGLAARVVGVGATDVAFEIDDDGTPVTVHLPFGIEVEVEGQRAALGPAPRTTRVAAGRGTGGSGGPGVVGPGGAFGGRLVETDEPPMDDRLYEALRAWRTRIAAEQGVPAYLVFHDRHLQVIAGRKPTSLRQLAGCPGVGPTKLERYGDDLLDVISTATDS